MSAEQKSVWKTPELIVLLRHKAEEAVLTGCKIGSWPTSGAANAAFGCNIITACATCDAHASS